MRVAFLHAAVVGIGGFLGALARYGLSGWVHRQWPLVTFPVGTLAVNLAGCFLIGVVGSLVEVRGLLSPEVRIFALIGVLGGFTTFSTLGYETFEMLRSTEYLTATANVLLHVVAGVTLVWLGYAVATAVGS